MIPLVGVILVGVAASFFAVVASDLYDAWDMLVAPSVDQYGAGAFPSRGEFIRDNLFNGDVLSSYGSELAWFAGFTALGIFGTLRRLFAER